MKNCYNIFQIIKKIDIRKDNIYSMSLTLSMKIRFEKLLKILIKKGKKKLMNVPFVSQGNYLTSSILMNQVGQINNKMTINFNF